MIFHSANHPQIIGYPIVFFTKICTTSVDTWKGCATGEKPVKPGMQKKLYLKGFRS